MVRRILLAFAVLGFAVSARAGALMVSESQFGDKTVTSTTKVGDQSVKIEMQGEKGMTSVIFRGGKQVFWMINDQDKTYREMTKAHEEVLRGPVAEILEQVTQGETRGEYTIIVGAGEKQTPSCKDKKEERRRY